MSKQTTLSSPAASTDSPAIDTTRDTLKNLNPILQLHLIDFSSQLFNQTPLYSKLLQHRADYYAVSAPHLLSENERKIEQEVDSRSSIFLISQEDNILCSLRLTRRPFELEHFNIHEIDLQKYQNYLEIGRLVTAPHLDTMTASLVVRSLLCAAGLWAIEAQNTAGFIAICRPFRIKFFNKFGLENLASFFSNERKINYHLLAGSMTQILEATTNLQKSETSLRRRLNKSFMQNKKGTSCPNL